MLNVINFKPIATLSLISLLTGCSLFDTDDDEYSCKGMPAGATCMSAKEVYSATNGSTYTVPLKQEQAKAKSDEDEDEDEDQKKAEPETRVLFAEGADNAPLPMRVRNPLPIRTQAVVMRIAVDPWEDKNGDLFIPGFIYTEIEPRRWEIGTRNPQIIPTLRPLSVQQ